jgi:polar amino acid transport system permease protein
MTAPEATIKDVVPDYVAQVARAERNARWRFRVIFAAVFVGLVAAIFAALTLSGNVDITFIGENAPYILGGVYLTVLVSVASIVLATALAIVGALGRLSTNPISSAAAALYVSLVRGTPLIVQIYFVFFALPQFGIVLPPIPAGIIALGFNYGAYMTEIFRAGIEAVSSGQREAGRALGMRESLVMRRIIFPQAFRIVIPAIGNEFIAMIKDSSLVSLIGIRELLWRAETVGSQFFRFIETLLIAAVVYWILTIVFSFFQERLERRLARSGR